MAGGNDAYTKLLIHANSDFADSAVGASETHTPTLVGRDPTKLATLSANPPTIDTGTKKYGVGSGKFVRTSAQYARFADSDDWYFGANPFTIRFWVNFTAHSTLQVLVSQRADTSNRWLAYYTGSGLGFFAISGGSVKIQVSCSWTPSDGTWYHLEFVRNGSNFYIFVDGVSQSLTVTVSPSTNEVPNLSAYLAIGEQIGDTHPFGGYIDDLEVAKGVARHTADFTAPAGAITPDEYTVLYCSMDSDFNSYQEDLLYPTIDTSVKKLGAGSGKFVASDLSYISYPDSADWTLKTHVEAWEDQSIGSWTIDFWWRVPFVGFNVLMSQYYDSPRRWSIIFNTNYLQFYSREVHTPYDWKVDQSCDFVPDVDTWYHLAFVWDNVTQLFYIFINGVSQSLTSLGDEWRGLEYNEPSLLSIGSESSHYFSTQYLDEIRISKGIARWTEDFTPPTEEYSAGVSHTLEPDDSLSFTDAIVKSFGKVPSESLSLSEFLSKDFAKIFADTFDPLDETSLGGYLLFYDVIYFSESVSKNLHKGIYDYLYLNDQPSKSVQRAFGDYFYLYDLIAKHTFKEILDDFSLTESITVYLKKTGQHLLQFWDDALLFVDNAIKKVNKPLQEDLELMDGGGFIRKRPKDDHYEYLLDLFESLNFYDSAVKYFWTPKNDQVGFIIEIVKGKAVILQDSFEVTDALVKSIHKYPVETVAITDLPSLLESNPVYFDNAKFYPEYILTRPHFYGGAEMFVYPKQTCIVEWEMRDFTTDTLYDPDSHTALVKDPKDATRVSYVSTNLVRESTGKYKYKFDIPADVIYGQWELEVTAVKGTSTTVLHVKFEVKKP